MRTHAWPALPAVALLTLTSAAAADRIAFVDLRRAISECAEGKALQKSLAEEFAPKQKEIEKKRKEVRTLGSELEKQEASLKPDQLAAKRRELQKRYLEVEEETAKFKRELARRETEALRPLADKMLIVIATIAQREKFTHILRQEIVLWTESRALDITNEVIRLADSAYAKAQERAKDKGAEKPKDKEKEKEKE